MEPVESVQMNLYQSNTYRPGFPLLGGMGVPPYPMIFPHDSELITLIPPLKNEVPPLKSKVPFQEMIPSKKKPPKLETVINTCISVIKPH